MSATHLRIVLDVTLGESATAESAENISERVFNLVGNDPDHLIDEIETVDNYEWTLL